MATLFRSVVAVLAVVTSAACSGSKVETAPPQVLESESGSKPPSLWEDCRAVQRDDWNHSLDCARFGIDIRGTDRHDFETLLETFIDENLRRNADPRVKDTIKTFQLHVGETLFPGRSYHRERRMTSAPVEVGVVVVGEDSSGATQQIFCHGKVPAGRPHAVENDCKAAMMYILSHGLPPDVSAR
jgi:hypothetical protein